MYRVILLKHDDGERLPLLVTENGFPIIEPNLFALTQRGLAWRTIKKKLRFISIFYLWASQNSIDLESRIGNSQLFTEEEINESLFSFIRKSYGKGKVRRLAVSAKTSNAILLCIREYLKWRFSKVLSALPSTDLKFLAIQEKQQIVSRWLFDAQLSTSRAGNIVKKNLSEEDQCLLIALVG